jgi:hypothetical protein
MSTYMPKKSGIGWGEGDRYRLRGGRSSTTLTIHRYLLLLALLGSLVRSDSS